MITCTAARSSRRAAPEHDVDLAYGVLSTQIGEGRTDDEVGNGVAVDVTRSAGSDPRAVMRVDAGEDEAAAAVAPSARQERRKRKHRREVAHLGSVAAEHD